MFQFHLVRLKESGVRLGLLMILFQFHLVRLKVNDSSKHSRHINVSIPFSTIKSQRHSRSRAILRMFQFHLVRLKAGMNPWNQQVSPFQFHLVRLKVMLKIIQVRITPFQFHLVRLKVYTNNFKTSYNYVSIPFSTIKSQQLLNDQLRNNTFQFHLVRLKDGLERSH